MTRNVTIGLAAGLVLALLAGGCGEGEPAADGGGKDGPPKVALVMKSLANEFFKTMEDGARAHRQADPNRYVLIANGIKDEKDVARQVALVEEMIARGVDALVIAPADSKALVPVCKKARQAGVVVVNIDNKLDETVLAAEGVEIPFVGPDNRAGARLAGEYLCTKLSEGDKVAIVEGVPNAFNAVQRKLGFQDAMNSCGAVVATSQSANWMPDEAEKIVAGMITQHPDLKAVLCANDSMALGAVAALQSAGKLDGVYVVGYDNISAVQKLMAEGKVLCTVDQHADRIAVYGIEHALGILAGQAEPEDRQTPVELVTPEGGK